MNLVSLQKFLHLPKSHLNGMKFNVVSNSGLPLHKKSYWLSERDFQHSNIGFLQAKVISISTS